MAWHNASKSHKKQIRDKMQEVMQKIMKRCDEWINNLNSKNINTIYSNIAYGKMLRSRLILSITPLESYAHIKDKIIDLCAIIELIQCASLLHDDVIDNSLIRRGKDSINATFGNKNAIMLGDVLYSSAYVKLCEFDKKIAQSIASAVSDLARGEIDDVLYSGEFQPDTKVYYQILKDKTAALIRASAESAALLGGLDSEKYARYGENLGIAFQIIDDILDITQDEKTLGKPSMGDLREGKSTLAYILLYHKLPESKRKDFLTAFKKADSSSIEWIKDAFKEYQIIKECQDIAKNLIQEALTAIKDENNQKLKDIAQSMIERNF